MCIIGITGPTGAGKTTALEVLREFGALIIDCDELYHELVTKSIPMRKEITARFGDVYNGDVLDRKKLGAVVFSDTAELEALNVITHKFVAREIDSLISNWSERGGEITAIDAIALIESGIAKKCDTLIAVTAPKELRVRRIMVREGIDREYALLRVNAQKADEFFERNCDAVLYNDSTVSEFRKKCVELFNKIIGGYKNGGKK